MGNTMMISCPRNVPLVQGLQFVSDVTHGEDGDNVLDRALPQLVHGSGSQSRDLPLRCLVVRGQGLHHLLGNLRND
jgi:hypothetical protein